MRVLMSCKVTNLDLHGEAIKAKIAHGHLAPAHLGHLQEDHDHHFRCRDLLQKSLKQQGVEVLEVRRGMYWPDMKEIDAVITVGGDGTLLEASHHIRSSDVPLIGLRSSPMSVGFLCYTAVEGLEAMVQQLVQQQLPHILTPRLQASILRMDSGFETTTVPILNDLLYTNNSPAATTRYSLRVNDKEEIQRSSGLWLATPAGSTGAIYAAGGKQVSVRSGKYQFFVRELHRIGDESRNSLHQGYFDPEVDTLLIENHCMKAMLALDGHQGTIDLAYGDQITLQRSIPLRLVTDLL